MQFEMSANAQIEWTKQQTSLLTKIKCPHARKQIRYETISLAMIHCRAKLIYSNYYLYNSKFAYIYEFAPVLFSSKNFIRTHKNVHSPKGQENSSWKEIKRNGSFDSIDLNSTVLKSFRWIYSLRNKIITDECITESVLVSDRRIA